MGVRTADTHQIWHLTTLVLGVLLLCARMAAAMSCAECVSIAAMLEERFDQLLLAKGRKEHQDDHEELSRTGRQFTISGLSEAEIMQTLGTFCSTVEQEHASPHSKHLQERCNELLTSSAINRIEDSVYQYGTKTVMSQMCIEIAGVCEHRNLIDRGEL